MADAVMAYLECARVCARTDYSDRKTVRRRNRAVERMYALVRGVVASGDVEGRELYVLLEDVDARPWIAHHLVEECRLPADVRARCIQVVRELADDDDRPGVIGEVMWLEQHGGV